MSVETLSAASSPVMLGTATVIGNPSVVKSSGGSTISVEAARPRRSKTDDGRCKSSTASTS